MAEKKTKNTFILSKEQLAQVNRIKARYPRGKEKSALIPVLHLAQECHKGWLSTKVLDYVARLLALNPIEVYEVATFYTMFNLKPVGQYVFEICQTGPCMLKGSEKILSYIQKVLDIEAGETTEDGLFTIKTVECLGACGYAPMLQLGNRYIEFLTEEKVDSLIQLCKEHKSHDIL